MQIAQVEVIPTQLKLRLPLRTAQHAEKPIEQIECVFVRIETQQGEIAWGSAAFDPALTGETLAGVTSACQACADRARDLSPLSTEFALSELAELTQDAPSAQCAFDIAFHDLLGMAAGMPLHRLLGGYRDRIPTSITVGLGSIQETVALAKDRARQGFRILKLKGGMDPEDDVRRVKAVRDALPRLVLRLDADGGYTIQQAIDVARALADDLEMLEQPVSPSVGIQAMREVTEHSRIPVLADQSALGPASALEIAGQHAASGISIKLAPCGGFRCARQTDAIARAAHLFTMVGCIHEPALLIAAELALALSSPVARYADLDGAIDLADDPSRPTYQLVEGALVARDVPGIGCSVAL